jgi:hypothetical protein
MIFGCEGKVYDTEQMTAFETGNAGMPTIFLTPDGVCVFVLTINRWRGVDVHQAGDAEITRLAQQFQLPQLLTALGRSPKADSACRGAGGAGAG